VADHRDTEFAGDHRRIAGHAFVGIDDPPDLREVARKLFIEPVGNGNDSVVGNR